eukprot:Nk52_evm4s151 gene=Nk52_evmTU4s151
MVTLPYRGSLKLRHVVFCVLPCLLFAFCSFAAAPVTTKEPISVIPLPPSINLAGIIDDSTTQCEITDFVGSNTLLKNRIRTQAELDAIEDKDMREKAQKESEQAISLLLNPGRDNCFSQNCQKSSAGGGATCGYVTPRYTITIQDFTKCDLATDPLLSTFDTVQGKEERMCLVSRNSDTPLIGAYVPLSTVCLGSFQCPKDHICDTDRSCRLQRGAVRNWEFGNLPLDEVKMKWGKERCATGLTLACKSGSDTKNCDFQCVDECVSDSDPGKSFLDLPSLANIHQEGNSPSEELSMKQSALFGQQRCLWSPGEVPVGFHCTENIDCFGNSRCTKGICSLSLAKDMNCDQSDDQCEAGLVCSSNNKCEQGLLTCADGEYSSGSRKKGCCGKQQSVAEDQVCCGQKAETVGDSTQCCGGEIISTHDYYCCGNSEQGTKLKLNPMSNAQNYRELVTGNDDEVFWRCCDGNVYDQRTSLCCTSLISSYDSQQIFLRNHIYSPFYTTRLTLYCGCLLQFDLPYPPFLDFCTGRFQQMKRYLAMGEFELFVVLLEVNGKHNAEHKDPEGVVSTQLLKEGIQDAMVAGVGSKCEDIDFSYIEYFTAEGATANNANDTPEDQAEKVPANLNYLHAGGLKRQDEGTSKENKDSDESGQTYKVFSSRDAGRENCILNQLYDYALGRLDSSGLLRYYAVLAYMDKGMQFPPAKNFTEQFGLPQRSFEGFQNIDLSFNALSTQAEHSIEELKRLQTMFRDYASLPSMDRRTLRDNGCPNGLFGGTDDACGADERLADDIAYAELAKKKSLTDLYSDVHGMLEEVKSVLQKETLNLREATEAFAKAKKVLEKQDAQISQYFSELYYEKFDPSVLLKSLASLLSDLDGSVEGLDLEKLKFTIDSIQEIGYVFAMYSP